jgi:hypothetical protein
VGAKGDKLLSADEIIEKAKIINNLLDNIFDEAQKKEVLNILDMIEEEEFGENEKEEEKEEENTKKIIIK